MTVSFDREFKTLQWHLMTWRLLRSLLVTGCLCTLGIVSTRASVELDSSQCAFRLPLGYTLGSNARCGFVTVPENRRVSSQRTLQLAVLVLQREPTPSQNATVFLQGGPGGRTQEPLLGFAQPLLNALQAGGDLIFFDQRGTGYSRPTLACPEVNRVQGAPGASRLELQPAYLASYTQCRQRLEAAGVDLSAYTTKESALDVDAVRSALGYERLNLHGVSYGSLLAQRVVREVPSKVRSIILDAVVDPTQSWMAFADLYRVGALARLEAACRADRGCTRVIPDFTATLTELMKSLQQRLPTVQITGTSQTVTLNGEGTLDAVDTMLRGHLVELVPYVLKQAVQGDYQNLARLVALNIRNREEIARGMYWSVSCAETVPVQAGIQALASPTELQQYLFSFSSFAADQETCRIWNVPTDWTALRVSRSDAPTLLLSGAFDPITPNENAQRVATRFPNARSVTFSSGGHGQISNPNPCVQNLLSAFLTDPSAVLDSSCSLAPLKFPYL